MVHAEDLAVAAGQRLGASWLAGVPGDRVELAVRAEVDRAAVVAVCGSDGDQAGEDVRAGSPDAHDLVPEGMPPGVIGVHEVEPPALVPPRIQGQPQETLANSLRYSGDPVPLVVLLPLEGE
jgi:hypothetical protein